MRKLVLVLLVILLTSVFLGCGGRGSEDQDVITPEVIPDNWQQVSSPGEVVKLIIYQEKLYAITDQKLFVSSDSSQSWQEIPIVLDTGEINSIDIDQDKIYLACHNGIVVSTDLDGTFSWSLNWDWDGCVGLDMQDGYGWGIVPNYGSMSGPIKKTPSSNHWMSSLGDIPWEQIGMYSVLADPLDPSNVAYLSYFVTTDGGEHWKNILYYPSYITVLDGKSTVFLGHQYSQDNCETYQPLGINPNMMTSNQEKFFAYCPWYSYKGIYSGNIGGPWRCISNVEDKYFSSICANDRFLFGNSGGNIYLIDLNI